MTPRAKLILAALVLAALLVGCGNHSFTRQRYETIYVGQPSWDVRQALGDPTVEEPNAWTYEHTEVPYYRAVIYLRHGRVVSKEWSYEPPDEPPTADAEPPTHN